jgi:hypothetical protein
MVSSSGRVVALAGGRRRRRGVDTFFRARWNRGKHVGISGLFVSAPIRHDRPVVRAPLEKSSMRWAIAVILVGALSVVSAGLGAGAALADEPLSFSGEISSIERSAKAIVVKGGDPVRKRKFFLARGAQVTSGGAPVSFAELKRGERVEITYAKSSSHLFARTVAVVGEGSAQTAAADE